MGIGLAQWESDEHNMGNNMGYDIGYHMAYDIAYCTGHIIKTNVTNTKNGV